MLKGKGKVLILFLILILPSLIYVVLATGSHKYKSLPYFGEKRPIIEDGVTVDTIYHTVQDFSFVNQFNDVITQESLEGKVTVVDYFFTTCGSICPKMSDQLSIVQERFRDKKDFQILSHTVNPEYDTVQVMLDYAEHYGAIPGKWHFLTGSKKELYEQALYSYLINAMEDVLAEGGFLHSEMLVLVDRDKHIRGFFDGTDPSDVQDLIKATKLLLAEKFIPKKDV